MKSLRAILSDTSLKARAVRSTGFTLLSFGGENALRLSGNLVLTRLLFPEAFGLMALVQVVMSGLAMFSDLGIRASIVQNKRGNDPVFLNTAWTMQIGRGFVLWVMTWTLAEPVALFYNEPLLSAMLPWAGLTAVFGGLASTRLATAGRDLTLGRLSILTLGTQLVGIVVTVALAFWLQSVWALVIGGLTGPALNTVLSHMVLPGHPNKPAFEPQAARELIKFGKYIFLSTIAGFFINHGDRAILGKFVTLGDLALYNIGFFMASVPLTLAQRLMGSVVFPLYAHRSPSESANYRAKIFRARRYLTGLTLSFSLVFALVGNWLVIFLYDARYEGAGPLMVLIALAQIPSVIIASYDAMALAAGHSGRFALMVISNAVIRTVVLILASLYFGVVGAALAALPATVIYYPILIWLIRPYKAWEIWHDMAYFAAALAIAAAVIWLNSDVLIPAFKS